MKLLGNPFNSHGDAPTLCHDIHDPKSYGVKREGKTIDFFFNCYSGKDLSSI